MRPEERWFKQAQRDFHNAKKNLEIGLYDVCLFLCQQSVEKALKALYVAEWKKPPPRVHSLEKLIRAMNLGESFRELTVDLEDYYFTMRYPDVSERMSFELCDRDDAIQGLKSSNAILTRIKRTLSVGTKLREKD
jgi:HEPN domain-containing protein